MIEETQLLALLAELESFRVERTIWLPWSTNNYSNKYDCEPVQKGVKSQHGEKYTKSDSL